MSTVRKSNLVFLRPDLVSQEFEAGPPHSSEFLCHGRIFSSYRNASATFLLTISSAIFAKS